MTVVGIADLALSVLLLNHINIQVSRARYAYMRMAVTLALSGRQVFLGVIYIARRALYIFGQLVLVLSPINETQQRHVRGHNMLHPSVPIQYVGYTVLCLPYSLNDAAQCSSESYMRMLNRMTFVDGVNVTGSACWPGNRYLHGPEGAVKRRLMVWSVSPAHVHMQP
jgi:hypothetical protein